MIDPSDLIKESKRGGKGATPFGDEDMASPERTKKILPGVNVSSFSGANFLNRSEWDKIYLLVLRNLLIEM